MPVNNQQYCGEIGVFHNKLHVIKCYYIFLDFQMCYSDRNFDFESLLMVLDLLTSFHFESLAYYVVIILSASEVSILIVLPFHIRFKCQFFNHIFIFITVLLNQVETLRKIQDVTPSLIKAFQFATGT